MHHEEEKWRHCSAIFERILEKKTEKNHSKYTKETFSLNYIVENDVKRDVESFTMLFL